jgi:hypothetical protein
MCRIFGEYYFRLCIAHSRDYAKKFGLPLSQLGYADKYSVLIYPDWIFSVLIHLGGEAEEYHKTTKTGKWGVPIDVRRIKSDYRKWFNLQTVPNKPIINSQLPPKGVNLSDCGSDQKETKHI